MKRLAACVDCFPAAASGWSRRAVALRALVAVLAAPACQAWHPSRPLEIECRWPRTGGAGAPALADLSPVVPYRNYLAVSQVDPAGEHFVIWIPQEMLEVRVARDASGRLVAELEGGMDGGVGPVPQAVPAMSGQVAALAHELELVLRARCPALPSWKIHHRGAYRRVIVQEFIAIGARAEQPATVTRRSGWFATYEVTMDGALQRVLDIADAMHGFGAIEVARDAQWLAIPPGNGTKLALVSHGPAPLASEIGDAARRFVGGAKGPALASLVAADAPLLPPGFVPRIVARVTLSARHPARPDPEAQLAAPIELHDAVFGDGARGDGEVMLAGERYRMNATLTPDAPRAATPGVSRGEFRGTLALHVEDDHGHAWEHAYPAHGRLDLEGDSAVAPWGVTLPGASSPSPEADALRGELPGFGPYRTVELRVDVTTLVDPRQ